MKKLLLFLLLFCSVNCFSQKIITCSCSGDSDGDGISNCFDKCPNTTNGISVDTHGCPRDTDGDGVADYKDEQLITPSECQPSDEKGIGFCPEPKSSNTNLIIDVNVFGYKKYSFASRKIVFDDYVIKMLDNLSNCMKANPSFKVVIAIYGTDIALINYEKLKSKINTYMDVEKEINIERIIFKKNITSKQSYIVIRNPHDGE